MDILAIAALVGAVFAVEELVLHITGQGTKTLANRRNRRAARIFNAFFKA